MNKAAERLHNGLIKENPTFVLMLGMCPTLAVTTLAMNGIGMGLTTTVILALSNVMISALRKVIPDGVRMPAYIVIVASFVTIVQFLLQAYVPGLYESLGIYIPLIVVNCIILGRAEMFASKNSVLDSALDGLGMGIGFTLALGVMGLIREFLGAGTAFDIPIYAGTAITPAGIFMLAPGGFFVFACLIAAVNFFTKGKAIKKKEIGCEGCAMASMCGGSCESAEEGKEADK